MLLSELEDSATDGTFSNSVFYAYTRRRASGIVDRPQAIFANEALLRRTSEYFEASTLNHPSPDVSLHSRSLSDRGGGRR